MNIMRSSHYSRMLALILSAYGCAQSTVSVNATRVSFEIVSGGPLGPRQPLVVQSSRNWTVKETTGASWISINPDSGAGPATISIGLNSEAAHRPVGASAGSLTITAQDGASTKVTVELKVVPHLPDPLFSYANGPRNCMRPPGYPDDALCNVPEEKPPGNFTPPATGQYYLDPNFGARVRILAPPRSLHGYSAPSVFSAHAKYALISQDGLPTIVEIATGKQQGGHNIPIEGPMWDLQEDETLYFLSGALVRKYNVRTRRLTTLVDYSMPPYRFTLVKTGSRGDTSKDNWIAFYAPQESNVCALDLSAVKTYCTRYDASYGGVALHNDNGGALIAKGVDRTTGKRYVILAGRPIAVFSVNTATLSLDFEYLGPEILDWPGGNSDGVCNPNEMCLGGDHVDTFEDASGTQYIMSALETTNPCEYSLDSFMINKATHMTWPVELGGGLRRIMALYKCGQGEVWADWHMGCARLGRYCVLSTTYDNFLRQHNAADTAPIQRAPHMSEIMVIRDNGAEVRRLMEHRSVPLTGEEARSYWSTPRANISADGAYVIADSNFGSPDKNRVILIETGFAAARPAAPVH